ncbi:ATPase, V0 complex, subunit E1/e2 [Auriculariales sp. MPI-PUGE-AT-0066]|nr:ATPase, V0 complex, subunit E1/e2 [Auriculariales sp. MPI-PUGE-AT-0066]
MASAFPVFALFVIALGLMAVSWLATPKGPQQTLLRTSFLLTIACTYLMWAITYLAQLHPLVAPKFTAASLAE